MKVDVIILAGGFATRFRPLSDYVPKPLFPIGGVPIINYILEKVFEISPENIVLSTNARYENHFRHWLSTLRSFYPDSYLDNIHIVVEPATSEEKKLGAIGGLNNVLKEFKPENDLLILLGDNLFSFDLKKIIRIGREKNAITLALYDVGSLEKAKNFGVVTINNEYRITSFEEKPTNPRGTLISTGIYFMPLSFVSLVDEYVNSERNKDAIGKLFEYLVDITNVYGHPYRNDFWFDIGTPELYAEANEFAIRNGLFRRWTGP
jgi:glucose-1-phosphate thymidylyltransferase